MEKKDMKNDMKSIATKVFAVSFGRFDRCQCFGCRWELHLLR